MRAKVRPPKARATAPAARKPVRRPTNEKAPGTARAITAARGRYMRCSAMDWVVMGTMLELGASTAKKIQRRPMRSLKPA